MHTESVTTPLGLLQSLLPWLAVFPAAAFLFIRFFPAKKEKPIAAIAIVTVLLHGLAAAAFSVSWLLLTVCKGNPSFISRELVSIYHSEEFEFILNFAFDKTAAGFLLTGAAISFIVLYFSRYYIHRDEGFKRFFSTVMLFYLGFNLIVLSGNFETLFVGWEFIGISSFVLIAFYRDRYLPVRNSLKTISLYRLSDLCLILAMWLSHHFWHANIAFSEIQNAAFVHEHFLAHPKTGIAIALLIILAAMIKSGLFPFSSWVPRAMEGPTSSSAVFYGAVSIHIGVFLLIRTAPLWEEIPFVSWCIAGAGLITALVANQVARVQPTVKTQIAYASVAQIGLIFTEVAFGWQEFAIVHFAGNAFLRTYQLLVSPSVLNYLIHDQMFSYRKPEYNTERSFLNKIRFTLYVLAVREWNLDHFLFGYIWSPLKWAGRQFSFLLTRAGFLVLAILVLLAALLHNRPEIPGTIVSPVLAWLALIVILASFASRKDAGQAWLFIACGQALLACAFLWKNSADLLPLILFLSGIAASAILGFLVLQKTRSIDQDIRLDRFHGYAYEKPLQSAVFLVSCLGLLCFPVTPAFIGIDILFTGIHTHDYAMIVPAGLAVAIAELALLRIYARIYLGQHKKADHPIAYRSS